MGDCNEILFQGSRCNINFLLYKLIELLQNVNDQGLSTSVCESRLISIGFSNIRLYDKESEIRSVLQNHSRIKYDLVTDTWKYRNPYSNIQSQVELFNKIKVDGYLVGLQIDNDILKCNHEIKRWVLDLIVQRKVRVIRPLSSLAMKGMILDGESRRGSRCVRNVDQVCDYYSSKKCIICSNPLGFRLFPIEHELNTSNVQIDQDIKELWTNLAPICEASLSLQYSLAQNTEVEVPSNTKRKRSQVATARVRRIQNSHLFTTQELLKLNKLKKENNQRTDSLNN